MVWVKKNRAGSDSLGHVWPEDGAIVEVSAADAAKLLSIPDGGFSEAPAPDGGEPDAEPVSGEPAEEPEAVAAGDETPGEVVEAPAPRRGRAASRKPAPAAVEE